MSEVKALFPIGKTQWRKWGAEQRTAFNEARASGVPFADAVDYVNRLELVEVNIAPQPKKKDFFDIIGDVAETVVDVAEVATPVIAVAKAVRGRKKAK